MRARVATCTPVMRPAFKTLALVLRDHVDLVALVVCADVGFEMDKVRSAFCFIRPDERKPL